MQKKEQNHSYRAAVRFLIDTIRPYRKYYFVAALIALVLVITELLQARLTQTLIDSARSEESATLIRAVGGYLALLLFSAGLTRVSGSCTAKLSAKAGANLKIQVADRLLYADYASLKAFRAGDTLQTVDQDAAAVGDFLKGDLIGLFSQLVMAIGALAYVVAVNPLLALITFLYTPLGMFFTLSLNKKMNMLYPKSADQKAEVLSTVEQALSCIPVIKAFVAEKSMRRKVSAVCGEACRTQTELAKWNALMQPACSSTSMVPRICYLIFAGYMAANGLISAGALLSVFDLLTFIIGPTVYLPFLLNGLNAAAASINRLNRLMKLPVILKKEQTQEVQGAPSVCLQNVSFVYPGGKTVFSGISFEHDGAGVIAVCGASGTGKTTLLDLMAGLYSTGEGTVTIKGRTASMPQEAYLFDMSVLENVWVARPQASEEEVRAALRLAGAEGIQTAANLSGGEKQRISLARAILSDAEIWLLDEPTSALDGETEEIILQTIRQFMYQKLIVLSSHRQSLLSLAGGRICL